MLRSSLVYFLFTLMLFASSSLPLVAAEKPAWIDNPDKGTVGSAGVHVRGRHEQQELAAARARTRLAARMGVEVTSIQHIAEGVVNDNSTVTSTRETTQKITNKIVKAYTRARWHDLERDIIYIWLYPQE